MEERRPPEFLFTSPVRSEHTTRRTPLEQPLDSLILADKGEFSNGILSNEILSDEILPEAFIHELTSLLEDSDVLSIDSNTHANNLPDSIEDLSDDLDNELSDSFIQVLTSYIEQPTTSSPIPADIRPRSVPESPGQAWKTKLADYYRSAAVRVDLKRLNRLNNLVSELMTQENSALLQSQHLQNTIHIVAKRYGNFAQILRNLNEWIDHSQKVRARLSANSQTESSQTLIGNSSEFDPLQMDAYSPLYTIAQDAMEEIAQLGEAIQDMTLLDQRLHETYRQRYQTLKQVHHDLLQTQMMPLADVVQRFPRMIRDLALQHRKRVSLKLTGTNTLMDKAILDKLMDPLVHLLRNAFDHGIEMPSLREVNNKSIEATIEIRAYQRGNQTYIEVRDDGRGIDPEVIRRRIVDRKLLSQTDAQNLSTEELYEYIFYPGFSTATKVTELSGRGVGMDAVRSQVRNLKGNVSVKSEVTKGTTFTLRFPLTLTVANLLIFRINTLLFALPIDTLVGLVNINHHQLRQQCGESFFNWEGNRISIYPAQHFLRHYPLPQRPQSQLPNIPLPQDGDLTLLVISNEQATIALLIDEVLQEQELVIKPFGQLIAPPPYLYGCTILGDGTLVPILDGQVLIRRWKSIDWTRESSLTNQVNSNYRSLDHGKARYSSAPSSNAVTKTILVVDDSLTARQFVALTLEKEGY
jgi:two-component system, chemotaxis family, sensor histidine kinase and response regulator PixL